jgi:hypothetical protein
MTKLEGVVTVRFCIPSLRTKIQLAKDWKFSLFFERRNSKMVEVMGQEYSWSKSGAKACEVVLPEGTVLSVDRIYVRNGKAEYDSVTFRVTDCPQKKFNKARFWAKLYDVNTMICYPIGSTITAHSSMASFAVPGQRFIEL